MESMWNNVLVIRTSIVWVIHSTIRVAQFAVQINWIIQFPHNANFYNWLQSKNLYCAHSEIVNLDDCSCLPPAINLFLLCMLSIETTQGKICTQCRVRWLIIFKLFCNVSRVEAVDQELCLPPVLHEVWIKEHFSMIYCSYPELRGFQEYQTYGYFTSLRSSSWNAC